MKKLLSIALLAISLFASQGDNVKIFTENYPPYNMEVNGELKGIAIEVIDAMFKQMKSTQDLTDVNLVSWSRAYAIAQKKKNAMVFSCTRTESREKLFKWVGPISKTTISVIALKSKNIVIKNTSDLKKYKVGAVLKDIGETLLIEAGVSKENIQSVSGKNPIKLSFTKMEKNRIDMFAYEENVAFYNAKADGFDKNNYEVVYTLKQIVCVKG